MRVLFIITFCFLSCYCYASTPTDTIKTTNSNNANKYTYILDNKTVSEQYILNHLDDIECIARYESVREAIFYSAGKYKVPAIICRSLKKESSKPMYHIKGNISDTYNNEYIKLYHLQGDTLLLSVDSARVENGKFYFEGDEYIKDFAILTIGNEKLKRLSAEAVLENGTIEVKMDTFPKVYGTYHNDLYNSLVKTYAEVNKKIGGIHKTEKELELRIAQSDSTLCKIMKDNCMNVAGQKFIVEYKGNLKYDSILSVYNHIEKIQKNNPWLTDEDVRIAKYMYEKDKQRKSTLQQEIIDIELVTAEGENRKLSEYIGQTKFLFIDFWASWCNPCIKDIPNLKQVYDKYKDKGLEMLSISIDEREKDWVRVMREMDMPWEQFILPKDSKAEKLYGISGIPYGILIDQSGKIVQIGVRAFFLDIILEALLKEE